MEFKILDRRGSFYQWDLDQKLQVEDPAVEQVHFAGETGNALVCLVYEHAGMRIVDVPNCVLQMPGILRVFAVQGNRTLYVRNFRVNPREKPADYIYTETENYTVEDAMLDCLIAFGVAPVLMDADGSVLTEQDGTILCNNE